MDTQTAISQLSSLIGQRKIELQFLELAMDNLKQTYSVSLKELDDTKIELAQTKEELSTLQSTPIIFDTIITDTKSATSTETIIK
jgi:hypothetical protein